MRYAAYHQIMGQQWDQLKDHTLCNLGFIESRARSGGTYDLGSSYPLVWRLFLSLVVWL
jgi:hypothetical protein